MPRLPVPSLTRLALRAVLAALLAEPRRSAAALVLLGGLSWLLWPADVARSAAGESGTPELAALERATPPDLPHLLPLGDASLPRLGLPPADPYGPLRRRHPRLRVARPPRPAALEQTPASLPEPPAPAPHPAVLPSAGLAPLPAAHPIVVASAAGSFAGAAPERRAAAPAPDPGQAPGRARTLPRSVASPAAPARRTPAPAAEDRAPRARGRVGPPATPDAGEPRTGGSDRALARRTPAVGEVPAAAAGKGLEPPPAGVSARMLPEVAQALPEVARGAPDDAHTLPEVASASLPVREASPRAVPAVAHVAPENAAQAPVRVPGRADLEQLVAAGSPGAREVVRDVLVGPSGRLGGSGAIAAALRSSGVIAPGHSPGLMQIAGDYTQEKGAVLEIELAGTAPDEFDRMIIQGLASLSGVVRVVLIDGFVPRPGDFFDVLLAGLIRDDGVAFQLPRLPDGVRLRAEILAEDEVSVLRLETLVVAAGGNAHAVAEPGTLAALALAGAAALALRRRRG